MLDWHGFCDWSRISVDNFVDSLSVEGGKPDKSRLWTQCPKNRQLTDLFKINNLQKIWAIDNFFGDVRPWYRCYRKFVHKYVLTAQNFSNCWLTNRLPQGFGMTVNRIHQRTDMFRRRELADAVTQVKDVCRAGGRAVGMRLAEAFQHPVYFSGNIGRRCKRFRYSRLQLR